MSKTEAKQAETSVQASKFKNFTRRDGMLVFCEKTLRSFRPADDKIGVACFYGNTTGEDANYRGKLPTVEAALAWLDADPKVVPT